MYLEKLAKSLAGLEFEVVAANLTRGGALRVTIDSPNGVSLGDCEQVSRHLEHVLPVEGVAYQTLEVSSPGPERALTAPSHFGKFIGQQAVLHLRTPRGECSTFTGTIAAADDKAVDLDCDEGVLAFGYAELAGANLRDTSGKRPRWRHKNKPA